MVKGSDMRVPTAVTGERMFPHPKSLYIEATGINADGSEFVVKMRLEATGASELLLAMENLTVEDGSNGFYRQLQATGEHNVKIEFTRCRLGDPEDRAEGSETAVGGSAQSRVVCAGSGKTANGAIYPLCQVCGREFSAQGRNAQARLGNAWQAIPRHMTGGER